MAGRPSRRRPTTARPQVRRPQTARRHPTPITRSTRPRVGPMSPPKISAPARTAQVASNVARSRRITGKRAALGVAAVYGIGGIFKNSGRAADRPRGRPTGMYKY